MMKTLLQFLAVSLCVFLVLPAKSGFTCKEAPAFATTNCGFSGVEVQREGETAGRRSSWGMCYILRMCVQIILFAQI